MTEPGADIDKLFILPGSRPITKIGNIEKYLESKLKLPVPTSTESRKIGTTNAVRQLGPQETNLICQQMSHKSAVSEKYYQATRGGLDAARAFHALEGLRMASAGRHVSIKLNFTGIIMLIQAIHNNNVAYYAYFHA